jgi:lysozyme
MKTSQAGIDLIKKFEGLRLEAYEDVVGVWTIGYGHTGDVQPWETLTEAEAEMLLVGDLEETEEGVERLVTVDLDQNEFDALVSFAFNVGLGALKSSTLLKLLNSGNRTGAAAQFKRWDKAGGKVYAGLSRRRAAEAEMFLG